MLVSLLLFWFFTKISAIGLHRSQPKLVTATVISILFPLLELIRNWQPFCSVFQFVQLGFLKTADSHVTGL